METVLKKKRVHNHLGRLKKKKDTLKKGMRNYEKINARKREHAQWLVIKPSSFAATHFSHCDYGYL